MTDEEKRKKILAMQAPSMRRIMERPESEDLDWQWRPAPQNWKAVPDAKTWEEQVGARAFTYEEMKVEQGLRYMRGQYLAEMRKEEPVSSVDEKKRERAINAFMFIKQTFEQIMKAIGLLQPIKKREFDYAEVIRKEKNEK